MPEEVLTPTTAQEQAEIIEGAAEKVFIAHCAGKTKAGKPLTRAEENRLNAIRHGVRSSAPFARDQTELASILGVSRKTVVRAMDREGHPETRADGRYEVKAWREFLAVTNEHLGDPDNSPTLKSERVRNLLLKNNKLEFDLAVLRREYILAEEVEANVREVITQAKKVLLSGPSSLAPQVVGETIPEAEKILAAWIHDALTQLSKPTDDVPSSDNRESEVRSVEA